MEFDLQWNGAVEHVFVASCAEEAERILGSLCPEPCFVGFDTEWGVGGDVALVQVATASSCVLVLLPEVCLEESPSLLAVLRDPNFLKVGTAVALDADLLRAQFGVGVAGCVDLSRLAAREGLVSQPTGLAALATQLLNMELSKDPKVRCSNWSLRPLSEAQLAYAARDALAGRDCALALAEKYRPHGMGLVEWCRDLCDKGKERGFVKAKKTAKVGAALDCGAYSCVTKFGLLPVLGSDGTPLLHMKQRTVEGLVRRGMASKGWEGDQEVIRLHFAPTDHYAYAGLDAAERNACVGCGSYGVARYYIVPRVFFAHLPKSCKSYNCHDVVMLCPRCRSVAEPAQLSLTQELLSSSGALRAGSLYANENALTSEQVAAKKAAMSLRRGNQLPEAKLHALRQAVATGLGVAGEIDTAHLQLAEALGSGSLPSERVVENASASPESLRGFLRMWRETFVKALQPKFLAEGWSLDTGLDGRFVPSVASSLEWPGDWRCDGCGVYCFGRSERCRCCGEKRPEDASVRSSSHGYHGCGELTAKSPNPSSVT